MPDRENKLPDRGRAYAIGGIHDYGDVTATVEVLDFYYDAVKEEWSNQQNCWRASVPMLKPRWGFGALAHRGMIFCVCGGSARPWPTNTVEVFDPKLGQWTYMADSPGLSEVLSFIPCSLGILKIGMASVVFTLHSFNIFVK